MSLTLNHNPIVHIRFEGRRLEVPLSQIVLDDGASEAEIRRGLARYLEVAETRLRGYVIEHDELGNLTVHPRSVLG